MNLTAEHATVVRAALAEGLPGCWLVIEGDPCPCGGDISQRCCGSHEVDPPRYPPADWVALTGRRGSQGRTCRLASPSGRSRRLRTRTRTSRTLRKRVTLAEHGTVPLAVATVDVLPVVAAGARETRQRPCVVVTEGGMVVFAAAPHGLTSCSLHRQPLPGKDWVARLSNLSEAEHVDGTTP